MQTAVPAAFIATCSLASVACASIVSTSVNVTQIAQPADAQLNVLPSTPSAFAWNEAQDFVLTSPLIVNASAPGLYDNTADLVNSTIPIGTHISSHYIHFDSPGSGTATISNATVTFNAIIIGVICINTSAADANLDDSDYLGAPTLFTHAEPARGLEFSANFDNFRISPDQHTIFFNLGITSPGDFIRVITMVPAPGAAALAAGALTIVGRRRR